MYSIVPLPVKQTNPVKVCHKKVKVYYEHKNVFFCLFPIISISQNFLIIFFLTLEKIGIDEKVICYHNISNLLWKKDVLCVWKKNEFETRHF